MTKSMTVILGERRRRLLSRHGCLWTYFLATVILLAAILTLYAYDCWREVKAMESAPAQWTPADAVVVLGAAVWPGGVPSPALRERTKEAVRLYQAGYVKTFITTGGVGTYPPSEASVAGELAASLGIPREAQLREEQSTNTWASAVAVAQMARDHQIQRVIVASDGFHLARAKRMFEDHGLEVQVAPAANVYLASSWLRYELRETAALMVYRLGLRS